jgi:hypothetical protein
LICASRSENVPRKTAGLSLARSFLSWIPQIGNVLGVAIKIFRSIGCRVSERPAAVRRPNPETATVMLVALQDEPGITVP